MKVAVFSTKYYEKAYLNKFNTDGKHQLTFFDAALNTNTTNLALGFEAVCVLLNDIIDKETIVKLAAQGQAPAKAKSSALAKAPASRGSGITARPTQSSEETARRRANTDIGWLD